MNLGDFFTPEAGQSRRAWLDALDGRIDETLAYYLGPQLMPRVRGAVGAANELTDFADYRDAVLGADQMATGATTADRIAGAGTMATGLAAMMVPGVSARMAEGATDVAGDLARFIADEDGGIRVWHGSPHDFDKFSMDAIGTGEGAQAYGHGLYFAENQGVAQAYQQALQQVSTAPADEIGIPPGQWNAFRMFAQTMDTTQPEAAARDFAQWTGRDVTDDLVEAFRRAKSPGRLYEVDLHANPEDFLDWDAPLSAQPSVLGRLGFAEMDKDAINAEALQIMQAQPGGAWLDDPVSRARVDELQDMLDRSAPNMTGQEFYRGGADGDVSNILSQMGYGNPAAQTEALREAGIPGIRYLDQGSRATTGGEILGVDQTADGWRAKIRTDNRSGVGFQSPTQMVTTSKPFATEAEALAWARDKTTAGTRNYVVFDENIIEIVKKYGIAGAAAMLGLSAADVEAQVAAQPVSIGDWLSNNDTATLQEYLR